MKRVPRYLLMMVGIFVALVLASGLWLLGTAGGARFTIARVIAATDSKLAVSKVDGRLAGPLTLEGVRWHDAGIDVRLGRVAIDFSPLALFGKKLHLRNVDIADAQVALTTQSPRQKAASEPLSLSPPLAIVLDRFHLTKAAVTQDDASLFTADTLDFGASWTNAGLTIQRLALRSTDGRVDLDGQVALTNGYPGQGKVVFDWSKQDRRYVGTLEANSDAKIARLNLTLAEPVPASLVLTLTQESRWPWTLALFVPRFDPKQLALDSTLSGLAFELDGSGDYRNGTLTGAADLGTYHVLLDPLRFGIDGKTLRLDALTLRSPGAAGHLDASGTVRLDATPPSATLNIAWTDIELPTGVADQTLATQGKLAFQGSIENYAVNSTLTIGPRDQPADMAFDFVGTSQAVTLKRLALKQPQGGLEANGDVALKPTLGWKIVAIANKFDPGAFAAQWPGSIDFSLSSEGSFTDRGPQATLKLDRLSGTLRQRPLAGRADLTIAPDFIVDGTTHLRSGQSTFDFTGRGGKQTDARVAFSLASLGDLIPDAQGSLRGEFAMHGDWPALTINGRVDGAELGVGSVRAGTFDGVIKIKDIHAPAGDLSLTAGKVAVGALLFDTAALNSGGDPDHHTLRAEAHGAMLDIDLSLSGAKKDKAWNGTLASLTLATKNRLTWKLEKPVTLALHDGTAELGELCLTADNPRLCLGGWRAVDGTVDAHYHIERLPLAQIAAFVAPGASFKLAGEISGKGAVSTTGAGAFNGSAHLTSSGGSVSYRDSTDPPLLEYSDFSIDAQLQKDRQHVAINATLANGKLTGDINASGVEHALSGEITLALNDLGFVELATTEVAKVKGSVDGLIVLSGNAAEPRLGGALTLNGFAAEVPSAGLTLHDGEMRVAVSDGRRFTVDGRVASGEGTLALRGGGVVDLSEPVQLTVEGEKFLAVDIPGAHAVISPKLVIVGSANSTRVTGEVGVPKANINLAKLPGGGGAKTSPDVIVTDAEPRQASKAAPIAADVTLKLGDEVVLKGFGLDGKLAGQLVVIDRPGKLTTGRGEIRVSGMYKAYGQDLKIQTGRLLFAGTAIDNPGLDLRAVRELKDVTAGLRVQGTAQAPVLTVYSEPAMEQSEALSYLVTGKSLSALKSGEGDMVQAATQALGNATGNLLAKSVGARLGVDAAVADSAALGGAAFTVGKYLSPKLYLSYGVGLFTPGEVITLRYLLSKRWNLEAQSATTENRAGLNYRWER